MSPLAYSLLVLTCFGGTIAGYILTLIAPEELQTGKRYFELFYRLMLMFSIAVSAFLVFSLPVGIVVLLALAYPVMKSAVVYLKYPYLTLGLLLFPFIDGTEALIAVSSMLFVCGLPLASIEAQRFVKKERIADKIGLLKTVIVRYVWFVPIGLLPLLLAHLK
jgi:hypothetical protein